MDIMLENNNNEKTKDESIFIPSPAIFVEISFENIKTKKQKHAERQKKYLEKNKSNPEFIRKKREGEKRRRKKYIEKKKNKELLDKQIQLMINEVNNFANYETIQIEDILDLVQNL
ncbi:hypothetical protein [Spiroplasma endosymbiont of Zeiraphera isertana]|uniref:hypothetical protein n=1 Tax=Spiroplasma endosymbiont of Zeiraphera isertana TaxID=3066313 RepID=UPI00313BE082